MRKTVLIAVLAVFAACVTANTDYDRVAGGYVAASIDYEAANVVLDQARAQRLIPDNIWMSIMQARTVAATNSSQLYALLKTWHATNQAPSNVDALLNALQAAVTSLTQLGTQYGPNAPAPLIAPKHEVRLDLLTIETARATFTKWASAPTQLARSGR